MFRKSPYLNHLPVLSLQPEQLSRYHLRRSTRMDHFCTSEVGALCLDVDWVQGDCFDLTLDDPQRVDCSAPAGLDIVRVENIVQGTSDPNECTEGGFPYEERNFIVCLEQL